SSSPRNVTVELRGLDVQETENETLAVNNTIVGNSSLQHSNDSRQVENVSPMVVVSTQSTPREKPRRITAATESEDDSSTTSIWQHEWTLILPNWQWLALGIILIACCCCLCCLSLANSTDASIEQDNRPRRTPEMSRSPIVVRVDAQSSANY